MEMTKHLRNLKIYLTMALHLLMSAQLQVARFTNLIAQLYLPTQATSGLRIFLGKSKAQEVSLQGTATTFAWDALMEALRQSWITVSTSSKRVTIAPQKSLMVQDKIRPLLIVRLLEPLKRCFQVQLTAIWKISSTIAMRSTVP